MYKNLVARRAALIRLAQVGLVGGYGARATAAAPVPAPQHAPLPLEVGFVYVTPLLPVGWTRQHELARESVEAAFGGRVRTRFVENVAEGPDAERVIRELAQSGCGLIFTTSFGYMEPTLAVARDYPGVKFESITGYKTAHNVAVANARYYEGRYLAGIAAGRMTRSRIAGYVAGFPIPEVLQGINAFALGLRSVNPDAQVKLIWLDTWFDPPRERDAAFVLMDQGADVLAFHSASTAVMAAAEQCGRLAIAYHSDMRGVAPTAQLAAVTHWWGDYCASRVRAVLDRDWRSGSVWGGVKSGMVRVGDFGPKVPEAVRREVLERQREIAAGALLPFAAGAQPVRDNESRIMIPAAGALSDAQILGMNWLVEGVQGRIAA